MNLFILLTTRFLKYLDLKNLKSLLPLTEFIIILDKTVSPSLSISESDKTFFDRIYKVGSTRFSSKDPLPQFSFTEVGNIIKNELDKKSYDDIKLICLDEGNLILAAQLREKFHIQGETTKNVKQFIDKIHMKEILEKNNITIPKNIKFNITKAKTDIKNYYKEATNQLGNKIVLKPRNKAGTFGVYIVNNMEQFTDASNFIIQSGLKYELETFIEGDLYFLDFLIQGKEISFSACCRSSCPVFDFIKGENIVQLPLLRSDPIFKKMIQFAEHCLQAFNAHPGAYHFELFFTPEDEIVFLEAAARPTGTDSIYIHEKMYGFSLAHMALLIKSNIKVKIPKKLKTYCMAVWAPIQTGQVIQLNEPNIISDYKIHWSVKKGDLLGERHSEADYACSILAWNDDYDILKEDYNTLQKYKPIYVENTE